MNPRIALLLLATLASAGAFAEDQIFKWRDAQGVWHFSSNAPDGVVAERVSVRHSKTVPTDPQPTAPAADGAAGIKTAAKGDSFIGPGSANCKAARDAVTVLENSPRVTIDSDGDGVQESLSAQEQIEELERRRAQAKIYCAES